MLNDVAPDDYLAAALMSSASTFSSYCGLSPDPWQHELLTSKAKRMLINCSRQSGKSTTLATLALHTALYKDESMVLMLSPSLRQSGEIFRKCLHVYRSLERPVPADSETALTLSLENGSRIVSLPGAEQNIRGYSAVGVLIVDEASYVPDELYFSVRPMLAVSGGRLLAAGTPWACRGWWYDAWVGGEDWKHFEVPATECPRISAEFLEEERRTLGPLRFASQYMCKFVDAAGAAFRTDEVERAFSGSFESWNLSGKPRY